MSEIREDIIDFLIHNRVSTTEVADVLGKSGAIDEIKPVNFGHYRAGTVEYVYAYDESNWTVHEQIERLPEGSIVFIDAFNCGNRAIFGELVSKYLLLYKQSKAIIVNGNIRDLAEIHRENYPIWAKGSNPVGCFNRRPEKSIEGMEINERKEYYEHSIAVCDDCGVVIIPKNKIDEHMLVALQGIEDQEDIWFDRLNHFKESTFDIVCKKTYLQDQEYMNLRKRIM